MRYAIFMMEQWEEDTFSNVVGRRSVSLLHFVGKRSEVQSKNKLAAAVGGKNHTAQLQLQTSGFSLTHSMKISSPCFLKPAALEGRAAQFVAQARQPPTCP